MLKRSYIILIIVVCTGVYINTFKNEFVYDDIKLIVENPEIRNLSNISHLKLAERPMRTISLILDYKLFKLHPAGYHLTNLILHILCSILVYFGVQTLVYRSRTLQGSFFAKAKAFGYTPLPTSHFPLRGEGRGEPLLTSLLFAVHPIQTEAVACISNRKEMLCMLFFMLSLILYIKSIATLSGSSQAKLIRLRRTHTTKSHFSLPTSHFSLLYYLGSIISFILALLSKQVAIALPFMLIIYDGCFNNVKKKKLYYIPYFTIIIIGYLLSLKEMQALFLNIKEWGIPYSHILLTVPCAGVKYLSLLIAPHNLCVDYFFPMAMAIEPRVIVSTIIIIGLIVLIFKSNRIFSFGILWILITLLPVLNIVPANYVLAERYLYLPSLGFCMVVAWLLGSLIAKRRLLGITILTLILLVYCGLTIRRNFDWRDNYTLWAKTVKQNPRSLPAHNNLGIIYIRNGIYNKALAEFNKVLEINPDDLWAMNNIGIIYVKLERYENAINVFKKILVKNPNDARAHYNLGIIYMRIGIPQESLFEYKKTIKIDPYFREAYKGLFMIYKKLGKEEKATQAYEQYMKLKGYHKRILQ